VANVLQNRAWFAAHLNNISGTNFTIPTPVHSEVVDHNEMVGGLAANNVAAKNVPMSLPTLQRATSNLPPFSWDTLPVAFHSASSHSQFSTTQIAELARYSMVTLEKFQRIDTVAPFSTLKIPYTSAGCLYQCRMRVFDRN
jgi:hypothetical protein